jgi:hypothetical protein
MSFSGTNTALSSVGQQRIWVPGKCSKTGIDIVWVCAFDPLQVGWVCEAITKPDRLGNALAGTLNSANTRQSQPKQIPPFEVPDDLFCPGCGIRKSKWRYWECGTCKTLNCLGSMRRGEGSDVLTTCGKCKASGPLRGALAQVQGTPQQVAPNAAPTTALPSPSPARKLLK